MNYFKFKCNDFKNFIRRSKVKLENGLYGFDAQIYKYAQSDRNLSFEKRVIKNLDKLTCEDKIIWSKDTDSIFRGVVIENCSFSDYKIFIERWVLTKDSPYDSNISQNPGHNYRIVFIKGILIVESIEHVSDSVSDVMRVLIETINRKLLQQLN